MDEKLIRNTYKALLTSHEDILNNVIKDTYPKAEQTAAFEDIKQFVYEDELKTIAELKTRIDSILDTYTANPASLESISNQLEHIINTVLIKDDVNKHNTPKKGLGKGITPINSTKDKAGKGVHILIPTDDNEAHQE